MDFWGGGPMGAGGGPRFSGPFPGGRARGFKKNNFPPRAPLGGNQAQGSPGHCPVPVFWAGGCWGRGSWRGFLPASFQEELFDIPKYVWFEDRGVEVAHGIFGAGKNVRAGKENHGLVFGEDFLRAIVEFFPLVESARR